MVEVQQVGKDLRQSKHTVQRTTQDLYRLDWAFHLNARPNKYCLLRTGAQYIIEALIHGENEHHNCYNRMEQE